MRSFLLFCTVLFALSLSSAAFAAKTLTVDKSHSSKVRIPDDGLILHVPEGLVVELSGVLSGKGSVTKQGAGTLILSGKNTYTGNTVIEAGVLRIADQQALNVANTVITIQGTGAAGSAMLESLVDFNLGSAGDFILEVKDGGVLATAVDKNLALGFGNKTRLHVSGKGSEIRSGGLMTIGQSGQVDLSVSDGAKVIAQGDLLLAGPGAVLVAYVAGDGATMEGASVYLGWQGQAEVNIARKGRVLSSAGDVYVGWGGDAKGIVLLDGAGSILQSARSIYGGYDGQSKILADGGAIIQTLDSATASSDIYLGYGPTSHSSFLVTGVGSKLSSAGALFVGYRGKADLNIQKKGQVFFTKSTWIGYAKTANGLVHLAGKGSLLSDRVRRFDKNGIFQGFVKPLPPRLEYAVDDYAEYADEYDGAEEYADDGYTPNPEELAAAEQGDSSVEAQDKTLMERLSERCIIAGFYGHGEIFVERGARVNAWGHIYAGYQEVASGVLKAHGSDSEIKADSNMYVGYMGYGEVIFTDYAGAASDEELNAENIFIAYGPSSKAKVTLASSSLGARNTLTIGNNGEAEVEISKGIAFVYEGELVAGRMEGSKANIKLHGAGARMFAGLDYKDTHGDIVFGGMGEATVRISAGGNVNSTGNIVVGQYSKGLLTLTGKDSDMGYNGSLSIGEAAEGEVHVLDHAAIKARYSQGRFTLGAYSAGHGTLKIDNGSVYISDSTESYIGNYGKGRIQVDHGGKLEFGATINIAYESGAEGQLLANGAGSTIDMRSWAYLGKKGIASVEISDGAFMRSGITLLTQEGGTTSILLDNAQFECTKLAIGYRGKGRLDVLHGSSITVKEDLEFGTGLIEAQGILNVEASKVSVGVICKLALPEVVT